jgi:hypothetical protein
MAPNKLETLMREKLNSREIQPSSQAWDRLDAMLSVAEEKKTKRSPFLSFQFIGIAASILVLLTVGMFLFIQKSTTIKPQNNVVGTEVKKDTTKTVENKFQTPIVTSNPANQIVVSDIVNPTKKATTTNNNSKEVSIINQKQSNQQNQIIKDKEIEFLYPADIAIKDMPKIQNNKGIISSNIIKSDDILLADLDKTSKQATNQKSTVKVDAKSLLSQVDAELDQTFREKAITKISKNYKSVKVALANRNNE